MYKNQLQELAQRSCFNLPSYSCVREGPDHAPRFKATVNFNGEAFESPTFCSTLRQAEHAAAEVALNTLASRGPSRALAARVLDETGVYKNLLQETAHRAGLKLPAYTTSRSGPSHVPLFLCKVELAGMSFTGSSAKTKKQAQKNAAMAAWSALKRLAQSTPSSSSSSSSSAETRTASEEQEQVIIARFLASLPPQELQIPEKVDCQQGQERVAPVCEDLTSPSQSLYPMQYQPWAYHKLCSEMTMYQMWQQQELLHFQSHLFMLQVPPVPPPGPRTFPYVQSAVPPDAHLFIPVERQEIITARPRIAITTSGLSICGSDPAGLHPIRGKSAVTIQEILEEKKEDFPSCSPSTDSNASDENINLGEKQTGHQNISLRSGDSGNKPVRFQVQNQPGFNISQRSAHYPLRSPSPRNIRPTQSVTHPMMIRARAPAPSSAVTPVPIRNIVPVSSIPKPRPPPRMRTGGLQSANPRFMAPAVRIRSVIPVCSAPPARNPPITAQEKPSPSGESNNLKVSEDLSTVSSNLDKLHI